MMFGCEETRRYVDAWVDGELDPGASLHVETHVGRCAECRAEAEMIQSLKRSMAALREDDHAPTALRSRLAMMLDAEERSVDTDVRVQQKRKHATGFVLFGAALAGLIVATSRHAASPPMPGVEMQTAGLVPPVLEDIAARHARDMPVEFAGTHPEQVQNFFRNRLDIPVRPVAFRGMSAQLVAAGIASVRGQTAAVLYYDVAGRRVTVFVFDSSLLPRQSNGVARVMLDNNSPPVYVGNVHGYTVALAERGGVGYAVASDLPQQDALQIVAHADLQ